MFGEFRWLEGVALVMKGECDMGLVMREGWVEGECEVGLVTRGGWMVKLSDRLL